METAEELGIVIARITQAVAVLSLPLIIKCIIRDLCYRKERLEQTFDLYAAVSGNIKVSKDGHSLKRLWQQQLMQFPLVAVKT